MENVKQPSILGLLVPAALAWSRGLELPSLYVLSAPENLVLVAKRPSSSDL